MFFVLRVFGKTFPWRFSSPLLVVALALTACAGTPEPEPAPRPSPPLPREVANKAVPMAPAVTKPRVEEKKTEAPAMAAPPSFGHVAPAVVSPKPAHEISPSMIVTASTWPRPVGGNSAPPAPPAREAKGSTPSLPAPPTMPAKIGGEESQQSLLRLQKAISERNREEVERLFSQLNRGSGKESLYLRKLQAYWYLTIGEYGRAESQLGSLLLTLPGDIEANLYLAVVEMQTSRRHMAKMRVESLLGFHPDDARLRALLRELEQQGR